ncbi:cellulose binding domain-containing protein [Spirosoma migulaei]
MAIDHWAQTYQYGPNRAAIEVNPGVSSLSISNSSIRNSQGRGMHISSSGVSVSNCTISNNGTIGINIDTPLINPVINSVVFSGNGNAMMAFVSSVGGLSNLTNADIQLRGGATETSCTIPKPGSGSYYNLLESGFSISANTVTSIQPGVEIRSSYANDQITINGTLLAQGTTSDSIRFTGFANPFFGTTYGGRFNFTSGSSNSVLSYVAIDRWGETDQYGSMWTIISNTGSMSVINSSIRNSKRVAIRIEPVSISPVISGVSFANNGNAILVPVSSVGGFSNLINADVQLRGGATETSCTIPKPGPGSYYNLLESGFSVSANTVTTIEPGAEIRSASPYDQIVVNGTLLAQGTASDSIRFTGFANPAYGSSHGGRINFVSGSGNSVLSYAVIDSWGETYQYGSATGAIVSNTSSLSISKATIRNSKINGIYNSSSPIIATSTIYGNSTGIFNLAGQPVLQNNKIFSNTNYGINNVSSDTVDARNTYWGASNGPFHPTLNPNGNGNKVSDRVKFIPWLEQVGQADQTINLPEILDKYVDETVVLNATATSNLPVSFSINTVPAADVASITSNTITFPGTIGQVTVTASQAGNDYFKPATLQRTFNVLKRNQSISVATIPTKTFGDEPFSLTAIATSGLPVTFSVVSGPATISGDLLTLTGAGSVVVEASQIGDRVYNLAIASTTFTVVSANPVVQASISPSSATLTCASPTVSLIASGGLSYRWEDGSENAERSVSTAGVYAVTVTSSSGSTATTSISVGADQTAPFLSINPSAATLTCASPIVSLTAVGVGSLRWDDNTTNAIQIVSVAGTYSVTLTGSNGCTATSSVMVDSDQTAPSVSINPSSVTLTCATPSVSLTAAGNGSVRWDNNDTNAIRTVSAPGTYSVTLTSPGGCTATASVQVSSDQTAPAVSITASCTTLTCANPTATLTVLGAGSVLWSTNSTQSQISVSSAGTYSVTLAAPSGCTASASVTINADQTAPAVSINPSIETPAGTTLTCASPSVSLTAVGVGTYRWNTGATSQIISATSVGTYSVTLTGANGCSSSTSIQVFQDNSVPTVSIISSSTTLTCASPSISLTAVGNGSVHWENGSTNAIRTVSTAGTYSLTLTGSNGCTASASVSIVANQVVPTVNLTNNGPITCTQTNVTLTASGGDVYQFSAGATQSGGDGSKATVSQQGVYSVTALSANGCSAIASTTVSSNTVIAAPTLQASATTTTNQPISVTASGCSGTLTWQTQGGTGTASGAVYTFTQPGSYILSATCQLVSCTSPAASLTLVIQATAATLSVSYQNADLNQPTNNAIKPNLQLNNEGSTPIPYGEITVRYWLTAENFAPMTNLSIYWAQLGTDKVKLKYVEIAQPRQGAFGYLEYSFLSSAGNLAPNSNSGPIQTGVGKQDWTNFNEADDYSFANNNSYVKSSKVTAYRNGVLIWGIEPSVVAPQQQLKILTQNQSSATTNSISTYLQLSNEGNVGVNYSDLKVRYYFTSEGTLPLNFYLDYAVLGNSNVKGTFVKVNPPLANADTYLELSFMNLSKLYPLSGTGNIQYRIAKSDWTNFTQTNDYSYQSANSFVENSRVVVYLAGLRVYGIEPGATSREAAPEPSTGLSVKLLGNPMESNQLEVAISGVEGQAVELKMYNQQGHPLTYQRIDQSAAHQRVQLVVESPPGVLLLQVRTAMASQSIRVVKIR